MFPNVFLNQDLRLCYLEKDTNTINEGRLLKPEEFKNEGFAHKYYYIDEQGKKVLNSRNVQ